MNIAKGFLIVFLLSPLCIFGNIFVLGDKILLNKRTLEVIDRIGNELLQKTNIGAYVVLQEREIGGDRQQRQNFVDLQLKHVYLNKSYFVIFIAPKDKKIDFFMSEDLKNVLDVNALYQDYMVPFLPIKKSDIMDISRISAITLNGYAYFSDALANYKGVTLENNIIDKGGILVSKVAHFIIKIMLIFMIVVFIFMYLLGRKK